MNGTQVLSLRFLRSRPYSSWIRTVDAHGGIFSRRWGDAAVRFIGVSMLAQEDRIIRFDSIPYWHKLFVVTGSG